MEMTEPHAILVTSVNGLAMRLGEAISEATRRTAKIDPCKPPITSTVTCQFGLVLYKNSLRIVIITEIPHQTSFMVINHGR